MAEIRRFGPPPGAAGVVVYEKTSVSQIPDPGYGTSVFIGPAKRGPMNVPVPITSKRQYSEIFSDPSDTRWHLFVDASHLMPDAIDGFFQTGNESGTVFVIRSELDGSARAASKTFYGRNGLPTLRIKAANEGRWGGYANKIADTPIIYATSRTFTLVAPGTLANEFKDAEVVFSNISDKSYTVVSNTKADSKSGETIFTIGSQYDLVNDGVSGPVALSGTASYSAYVALTGTIAYPLFSGVTGTANIRDRTITGTGTAFSSELKVGQNVYYLGEARSIESITSDTTLVVSTAFSSSEATGVSLQKDNLTVTGNSTTFSTEVNPGDTLFVTVDGVFQGRKVKSVGSNTSLILESGFTKALSAGTQAQKQNYTVTGTGSQFTNEVRPGQFLVDPNRSGKTVQVVTVDSATKLTISQPFASNFNSAQIVKQSFKASVTLSPDAGEGIAIELSQGLRKPETHFTITIYFNGSQVLQVPDCSLDSNDPEFVDTKVAATNLAHTDAGRDYAKWIEAESLWASVYTTSQSNDVRPCNGSGTILLINKNTLYTVADLDYSHLPGQKVYPNPYEFYRSAYTIASAVAPKVLDGTYSSLGVNVTGVGTTFLSSVKVGDYLYDARSNTIQQVRAINSDTQLTLVSAFSTNVAASTPAKLAGRIVVSERYDLESITDVGNRFTIVMPQYLERGYDGPIHEMLPFYYTKYFDTELNPIGRAVANRNLGLVRITVPGVSDETVQKAGANFASTLPGEYRYEIPSYISSAALAEAFLINNLGRNDFASVAFPTYGTIANPFGRGERLISINGDIMGGESKQAIAETGYHAPFAGKNAILPRIIKLSYTVDLADEAILNLAGIQPIKFLDGNAVVWGARAPSASEAYKFLHIRRTQSSYTRVLSEARNLLSTIFLPNQPGVLDGIKLMLDDFAIREYTKGAITQYLSFEQSVQIGTENSTNLTAEVSRSSLVAILNGELSISFRYVPTGLVEILKVSIGPDLLVEQFGSTLGSTS